ncbi:UNVERIFIED_CONTAM: hypothetical protein FKN15_072657 [Acipenser sinensis]
MVKNSDHLFGIIASVLHLGNIQYDADNKGSAIIGNNAEVRWISKLLGVSVLVLQEALTHRKIETRAEEVLSPLNADQAYYARDALAKAIYGRTFTWLVNKINESLANQDPSKKTVIGLLDIYGFEVFYINSFEQFCINYCNEKLQQLFIQLTLKSEQEEYEMEGIEDPSKKTVIGLLDIYGFEVFYINSFEQFCINYCNEKLQQLFIQLTLKSEQEEYEMEGIEWEPVQYFNNKIICDLVEEKYRGIISVLDEECLRLGGATDLTFLEKLEETVGNHPHFVTHKLANQKTRKTLERGDFRLLHYAGEVTYCVIGFLDKNNDLLYRNIKESTLENSGIEKSTLENSGIEKSTLENSGIEKSTLENSGIEKSTLENSGIEKSTLENSGIEKSTLENSGIEKSTLENSGIEKSTMKKGPKRLFIKGFMYRNQPLCDENAEYLNFVRYNYLTRLREHLPKHVLDKTWLKPPAVMETIETCFRGVLARRNCKKREWAVVTIKKFIKGFMYRNQPLCDENAEYLNFVRYNYLTRLREHLPKHVLDKTWLKPPAVMETTSEMLRKICYRTMVRRYVRGVSAQRKAQLQLKVVTSAIFKGKKEGYPQTVPKPFTDTRLSEQEINMKVLQMIRNERIKYGTPVVKYDRNGYKPRPRQLVLTQGAAYMGDVILQCDHVFETVTKLCVLANKQNSVKVVQGSMKFTIQPGKEGIIDFSTGQEPMVYKAKNGHLMVVSEMY